MTSYEYNVIETKVTGVPMREGATYAERVANGLNEFGERGWELCGVLSDMLFFKRPRKEQEDERDRRERAYQGGLRDGRQIQKADDQDRIDQLSKELADRANDVERSIANRVLLKRALHAAENDKRQLAKLVVDKDQTIHNLKKQVASLEYQITEPSAQRTKELIFAENALKAAAHILGTSPENLPNCVRIVQREVVDKDRVIHDLKSTLRFLEDSNRALVSSAGLLEQTANLLKDLPSNVPNRVRLLVLQADLMEQEIRGLRDLTRQYDLTVQSIKADNQRLKTELGCLQLASSKRGVARRVDTALNRLLNAEWRVTVESGPEGCAVECYQRSRTIYAQGKSLVEALENAVNNCGLSDPV